MSRHYNSCYGLHLKQFVDMKRTLGFKYKTQAVILYQIDRLAEETEESSRGITKEFADKWRAKRCYVEIPPNVTTNFRIKLTT